MTELKEEFKELQSLTKDNATDDDKKRVQELLTDIANDVLGGSKLSPEEYSIVASAFKTYKDNIQASFPDMEHDVKKAFHALVQELKTTSQKIVKENTAHKSGKNNLPTIFNSLKTYNLKKQLTENGKKKKQLTKSDEKEKKLTKSDEKEIKKQLTALNKEMSDRNLDVSFLTPQQKETLKDLYANFPKIVDATFTSIENDQKSAGFVGVYNEMSGKNEPVPVNEELLLAQEMQKIANDFGTFLKQRIKDFEEKEKQPEPEVEPSPSKEEDNAAIIKENRMSRFKKQYPSFNDQQLEELIRISDEAGNKVKSTPGTSYSDEFASLALKSNLFNDSEKEAIFEKSIELEQKEINNRIEEILGKNLQN